MRVVIVGAAGRMGRCLRDLLADWRGATLVAAIDRTADAAAGITTDLSAALVEAQVMLDFSSPARTVEHLDACAAQGVAALVGTTGLGPEVEAAADRAARAVPVLIAANTSLGVTLLIELVRAAARALPADFDLEIIEAHHRHKQDAPSGTALALGAAAAGGRGESLAQLMAPPRVSGRPRRAGEIGFAVLRGGDLVGSHTVLFAGSGEQLTLAHQATDRAVFARGALQAAAWLVGQRPGRYAMADVVSGYKNV